MSILDRFIKYIKIASPSGKEQSFAKVLMEELIDLGFKPCKDSIGNIYVNVEGDDSKSEPILLNAHIDTVAHDGDINPKIKNGIITSDGKTILGADNKAGVAVIMETLNILKNNRYSHPNLQVIFTVQEEIGLKGAKIIDKKKIKAKIGFVLDGGKISVIHNKAPAQKNLTAQIIGKSAHAGVHPEDGINAIKVASEAISKMKLGRVDFETTANIGIISGGNATNIIPDLVFIKGEARSHNGAKLKAQIAKMENVLKNACRKNHAKVKIKIESMYYSFEIKTGEKILRKAMLALTNLGIKGEIKETGGGSDANIFNKLDIKTAIIGVGARHVHTNRECIRIKDLELGVKYLLEIIKQYALTRQSDVC